MAPLAIFLHGSIGVGKSTLGVALAEALGGRFTDGDSFLRRNVRWFQSSRAVAQGMAAAAIAGPHPAVLAYPLRCTDMLFLRGTLARAEVRALFVNLHAPLDMLMDVRRGRVFDGWERARTAEMIAQGYNDRPWADLRLDTSRPAEESLARLHAKVTPLLRQIRCQAV